MTDRNAATAGSTDEHYEFPNYDKYARFTSERNWDAICRTNGVPKDAFGTRKELAVLGTHLEKGEVVFALTSGIMDKTQTSNKFDFGLNTWLVVLTSERFLFIDCAMMTRSVDTQSVRHEHAQAVSASQGWLLGKIQIDLGSRTIVIDNCQKATVKVFADLANKWLRHLEYSNRAQPVAHGTTTAPSVADELKKLAALRSDGVLTDEEFAAAKARLLGAM